MNETVTNESELLTADEVAAILGVNKSWVWRHARQGTIPVLQLGRYKRFRRESINQFIRDMERPAISRKKEKSKDS